MSLKRVLFAVITAFFAIFLSACGTPGAKMGNESSSSAMELYEVFADGRDYVFYDRALYKEFLSVGETPFRLTKIGEGPNGMTLVYGLTKQDKKLKGKIPAIEMYEGKVQNKGDFYGEMIREGRIYVFSKFEDMKPVRDTGYPSYHYTEIGAGPKGETVVYVLNHHNKKHKPDALINKFKAMQTM